MRVLVANKQKPNLANLSIINRIPAISHRVNKEVTGIKAVFWVAETKVKVIP